LLIDRGIFTEKEFLEMAINLEMKNVLDFPMWYSIK